MPLTKKGEIILNKFKRKYGAVKGENYFYAYMKLNPKKTIKWHR